MSLTIEDIVARLEKATGPDRELDARIELSRRRFLFGAAAVAGAVIGGAVPEGWIGGIGEQPIKAPAYTASLDAALTLVPEDGWLNIGHRRNDDGDKVCVAGFDCAGPVYAMYDRHPSSFCIALIKACLRYQTFARGSHD